MKCLSQLLAKKNWTSNIQYFQKLKSKLKVKVTCCGDGDASSCKGHKKVHTNHSTLFLTFFFFSQVTEHWRWYITKICDNTCGYMLASKQYCFWDICNNTGQTQSGNISSQHSAHSFLSISLVNNLGGGDWKQHAPTPTFTFQSSDTPVRKFIHFLYSGAHARTCPTLLQRCTHTMCTHSIPLLISMPPPSLHTLICEVWVVRPNRLQAGLYCISVSFPTHSNSFPSLLVIKTRTKTRAASHHPPTFICAGHSGAEGEAEVTFKEARAADACLRSTFQTHLVFPRHWPCQRPLLLNDVCFLEKLKAPHGLTRSRTRLVGFGLSCVLSLKTIIIFTCAWFDFKWNQTAVLFIAWWDMTYSEQSPPQIIFE